MDSINNELKQQLTLNSLCSPVIQYLIIVCAYRHVTVYEIDLVQALCTSEIKNLDNLSCKRHVLSLSPMNPSNSLLGAQIYSLARLRSR